MVAKLIFYFFLPLRTDLGLGRANNTHLGIKP